MPLDISGYLNDPKNPQQGQTWAGKVWTNGAWQDQANPNDYNQSSQWAVDAAQRQSQAQLYDPATLKSLQSIFGPYFAQQRSNLSGQMNTDMGNAGRQGGAYAAASGLANPGAYSSGARQRVTQAYAPAFGNLQTSQLGQLLNAGAGSSVFTAQNMQNYINTLMQKSKMNLEDQNSPSIWGQILAGIIQGGATVAGAAIKK